MRIDPLFAGRTVSVFSVLIASVIGVGAVTGWLHGELSPKQGDARLADPGRNPVPANSCALCGTVESIRTVEVRDEAASAGAAAGRSEERRVGKECRSSWRLGQYERRAARLCRRGRREAG